MDERLPSPLVAQTHDQHQRQQESHRSHTLKPPTSVYSMRTAMPHFVSALRVVDEWKRQHAGRAQAIAQAEYDVSAKFIKSPFARSIRVEDLVRFVDDTQVDINFMVQLPSIEKCLEQWWRLYVDEMKSIDQDHLRTVFYDLATVLVEAKTENIHKNSVSMIVRGAWAKWSLKEPPLTKPEFFRLLFILAHLMTTSNRLNDYVVFLQETLARITRVAQSKAARSALRQQRKPRSRRKLSVVDIMSGGRSGGPVIVPLALTSQGSSGRSNDQGHDSGADDFSTMGIKSGGAVVSVKMDRIVKPLSASGTRPADPFSNDDLFEDAIETLGADRFVEVLERNSRCQHIVVDPLLHEHAFQQKWKRASNDATKSLNALAAERNPITSAFAPPMMIHRLRASRSVASIGTNSAASLLLGMEEFKSAANFTTGEEEILRRSLSRVTLKDRVAQKKLAASSPHHMSPLPGRATVTSDAESSGGSRRDSNANKQPVYLAIST